MPGQIQVDIWWTDSVESATINEAEDAIENLANQLGTSTFISRRGEYSGSDNHGSYDGYMREFRNAENHFSGFQSLLLYNQRFGLDGDGDSSSHPNLGMARGSYQQDENSYTIVNSQILQAPLEELADFILLGMGSLVKDEQYKLFENMIMHELLHNMMDDDHAPDPGDDHSFGEVKSAWHRVRDRASPMLTGYTEPASANDPPDEFCIEDSNSARNWTDTLSTCTENEGIRWLESEYYSGGGIYL